MNPVRESTDVLMLNLVGLITNHTMKPTTLPFGRTTLDCPTSSAQILIETLEKVSSTHTVNKLSQNSAPKLASKVHNSCPAANLLNFRENFICQDYY